MNNLDKPRFAELMASLAQSFRCEISAFDIEDYWCRLKEFSLMDVEQAVTNYCNNSGGQKFIPTSSEIIAYIKGDNTGQAARAWAKVMHAIRHIGSYSSVIFDDAIIHAVLYDMGGWIKVNEMLEKDAPYRERDFEKLYKSYLISKPTEYPKQLSGITETNNAACGYETKQLPILIGDEQQALFVFENGCEDTKLLPFKPLSLDALNQLKKLTRSHEPHAESK